jgi:prepilin-type N-terminal cleavage/methylation domain-containing protein
MRKLRTAFTLIEMLISITIFSIMMLYLYNTYSSLNISNNNLKTEVDKIKKIDKIRKVIFLDFTLAIKGKVDIQNRDKDEDFVFFQSSHSIHRRFNPYIAYMVKEKHLYRLESLKKISSYELSSDAAFDIEDLGEVKSFRVYKTTKKSQSFLVAIDFVSMDDVLLKVNPLNQY